MQASDNGRTEAESLKAISAEIGKNLSRIGSDLLEAASRISSTYRAPDAASDVADILGTEIIDKIPDIIGIVAAVNAYEMFAAQARAGMKPAELGPWIHAKIREINTTANDMACATTDSLRRAILMRDAHIGTAVLTRIKVAISTPIIHAGEVK